MTELRMCILHLETTGIRCQCHLLTILSVVLIQRTSHRGISDRNHCSVLHLLANHLSIAIVLIQHTNHRGISNRNHCSILLHLLANHLSVTVVLIQRTSHRGISNRNHCSVLLRLTLMVVLRLRDDLTHLSQTTRTLL